MNESYSRPVGSTFVPPLHQQMAAVAELRWRLFVNSMRGVRGRLELASRIFLGMTFVAGGIGGGIGLGGAAWLLTLEGNTARLGTLLWPVFLFWQLFPLTAPAFTQNPESVSLLRFPLGYRAYFLSRMAYGSLDPATTVSALWLLGITIGVGAARPRLLPWTAIVIFTFAVVNLFLARTAFEWVGRWLAQRRTREIIGALFFLSIVGLQMVGPLIAFYGHKSKPEARLLWETLSNGQKPLPPALAAHAIAETAEGRDWTGVFFLLLLALYGVAFLWLLNFRLRAQYHGENLSQSAGRRVSAGEGHALRASWRLPGLPKPVAAVFEKEIRYLGRSGPMIFTLVVPLFMLLVFRSSGHSQGLFAHAPGLTFPLGAAYSLLLLTNLSYNNLGADGRGVQFFFAAPVRFRQIVAGKNLAHAIIFSLEVALVWLGTSLLYRPPSLRVTVATAACILFAVPIDFAVGNLLSIYSPTQVEVYGFGRQRASLTTVLASLGIRGLLFGGAGLMLLLSRLYGTIWILLPPALSCVAYVFVLERLNGIALRQRENIISRLGQ
jgi:ABC-2 type transport system permease protein